MNNPLVSVIIPCYNQAQFLPEALQSVLEQTYQNWECIIVNDGSPDNTHEVAQIWLAKDKRFKYIEKINGGLSSARNAGLDITNGSYIQFLDSDDILDKIKLELSLAQMDSQKAETKVVISNFSMFVNDALNTSAPYCNLNNKLFNFESLLYQWGDSFTIPIHCGFFKASLFKDFRFPEHLKAKEDWIMWVSLFNNDTCKAVFLDYPLALYRINLHSMTMTKDMLPDFINAFIYFKGIVTESEFNQLSVVLISRYHKNNDILKFKLNAIKKSNSYQTGLLIKKVLKSLGVLKLFKGLFLYVLKLKSK